MRKVILSLCLLMLISIQVTGCNNAAISTKTNKSKTTESNIKKSDKDIIELAYQSLSENHRKTVVEWERAKVEEYKSSDDHSVGSVNGLVNIKDKYTYKVTFRTNNEGVLGPITIYMDKNTYDILGIDLRD